MTVRQIAAERVRADAGHAASQRTAPDHRSNNDERRLRDSQGRPTYAGSFTKCLHHDDHGFVADHTDYEEWVHSIDSGSAEDIARLRIGPGPFEPDGTLVRQADGSPVLDWEDTYPADDQPAVRAWESQGAGLNYNLEGPDPQSVTMPPAPALDSQEVIAEMAEMYEMALCRDVPFAHWGSSPVIADARSALARLWWFRQDKTHELTGSTDRLESSLRRRRVLSPDGVDPVPLPQLFRGVTYGEQVGPYVSQFLLVGNTGVNGRDHDRTVADGLVSNGSLRTDQRVRVAEPRSYLTTWPAFLDAQNGAALRDRETYEHTPAYRFVCRPRDLATYVHYDALYEAYLNACLILLGLDAPVDPGLPFDRPDHLDKQTGFAQFGAPHVLALVTEVSTRALKAVRYQKYNVHRRLRPEALGGWMYQRRHSAGEPEVMAKLGCLSPMEAALAGSSGIGADLDAAHGVDNWLLPMAYAEGSPVHPSYGAGHGTVAGACVTILKAWFDSGAPLLGPDPTDPTGATRTPIAYEATADGSALVDVAGTLDGPLTIEGELNKLGANIALGRGWAGVHYYSDYLESYRLGEQVAIRLLEEQKGTYGENFSLTVPLFDGSTVRI